MRWAAHVALWGRGEVRKPEENIPLERPRPIREDNIKMDVQEVGWTTLSGFIWLMIGKSGGLL
jgi:hypothetical protein